MKFLAIYITYQKFVFYIFMVGNLQNIFTGHDLYLISYNDFWHNRKVYHFDPYSVLLAIATYISMLLMWFCGQGHIHISRRVPQTRRGNVTTRDQHLGQRHPSESSRYLESPKGEWSRSAHGSETFVNASFWLGESAPWKQGPCVDAHGRTSISRMNQKGAASASPSHYDPQRLTITPREEGK